MCIDLSHHVPAKNQRRKDGKAHNYWNIVGNKRLDDSRVVRRPVLSLGEINASRVDVWRKAVEVFDAVAGAPDIPRKRDFGRNA